MINETKQLPTKFIWDFDQWFKTLMVKVSFGMSNIQNKEWFIATLVPYICMPLMHHNIAIQIEALDIAMNLEASLVGKTGVGMS